MDDPRPDPDPETTPPDPRAPRPRPEPDPGPEPGEIDCLDDYPEVDGPEGLDCDG